MKITCLACCINAYQCYITAAIYPAVITAVRRNHSPEYDANRKSIGVQCGVSKRNKQNNTNEQRNYVLLFHGILCDL